MNSFRYWAILDYTSTGRHFVIQNGLRNYLWCYVGRKSVKENAGEDLACYGKKRNSSIVPIVCSITFLVDGYNSGSLSYLWYRTHLPGIGD